MAFKPMNVTQNEDRNFSHGNLFLKGRPLFAQRKIRRITTGNKG